MTCTALCERGAVSLLLLDRLKHRGEQLEGREEDVRTNRVDDQMELSRASVDEGSDERCKIRLAARVPRAVDSREVGELAPARPREEDRFDVCREVAEAEQLTERGHAVLDGGIEAWDIDENLGRSADGQAWRKVAKATVELWPQWDRGGGGLWPWWGLRCGEDGADG